MPTPDEFTRAYQRQVERLRSRTGSALQALWLGMPEYRDAQVDRFVQLALPIQVAAQREVRSLTAGYHSAVGAELGDRVPMALISEAAVTAPRGVAPAEVYRRPAVQVYTELSRGSSLTAAVTAGATRLQSLSSTDLQLVKADQSRESMTAGGYTFFRRTLTGLENCDLCTIASTQRYRVINRAAIHGGCDCSFVQVTAGFDPGQVLDPELLQRTQGHGKQLAALVDEGAPVADFQKLVVTREHGEYGATLSWRGDAFTGPADL